MRRVLKIRAEPVAPAVQSGRRGLQGRGFCGGRHRFQQCPEDSGNPASAKCLLQPRQCIVPARGEGCRTDPQSTIKTWQQSLGAYRHGVAAEPSDADAKFNRNVVKTAAGRTAAAAATESSSRIRTARTIRTRTARTTRTNRTGNRTSRRTSKDQQDQQNQQQNHQGQQNQQGQQGQQNQPNQQPTQNQPGQQPAGRRKPESGQRPEQRRRSRVSCRVRQDIGKPDQLSRAGGGAIAGFGEGRGAASGHRRAQRQARESRCNTAEDW